MNKRDVFEIAIRMLGLYFLMLFLTSIPALIAAFISDTSAVSPNKSAVVVTYIFNSLSFLFVGLVLALKGEAISGYFISGDSTFINHQSLGFDTHSVLSVSIKILGLFYFVRSVGTLSNDSLVYFTDGIVIQEYILARLLVLLLSIVFLVRTDRVISLITKEKAHITK